MLYVAESEQSKKAEERSRTEKKNDKGVLIIDIEVFVRILWGKSRGENGHKDRTGKLG